MPRWIFGTNAQSRIKNEIKIGSYDSEMIQTKNSPDGLKGGDDCAPP